MKILPVKSFIIAITLFSFGPSALAADFSAGSFIVRDPVISEYGGRESSASFGQISSGGQAAIGESTSGSFIIKSGFLYFTDVVTPAPPPSGPGPIPLAGGGPLSPTPGPVSGVTFNGVAYPLQPVVLLKDGQLVAATVASLTGEFTLAAYDLTTGGYRFGIIGTDIYGQTGAIFLSINFERGVSQRLDDVVLPPTIAVDQEKIFGQTAPLAEVVIYIDGEIRRVVADGRGLYSYPYARLMALERDVYKVKSQAFLTNGRQSPFSREVILDLRGELPEVGKCPQKGDLNNDCRVNLVDLSIMVYWWERVGAPARIDLSGDGKINLVDFSILVYYWTG